MIAVGGRIFLLYSIAHILKLALVSLKQFAHNWPLPCCQSTGTFFSCLLHTKWFLYAKIRLKSSVENRLILINSCCDQYVILFSWCHSVFCRMDTGRVVSTLATAVGGRRCHWYFGPLIRSWRPPHEAYMPDCQCLWFYNILKHLLKHNYITLTFQINSIGETQPIYLSGPVN